MINIKRLISTAAIALIMVVGLANSVNAANYTWSSVSTVVIGSNEYTIASGSASDTFVLDGTTLTVNVPALSTFTLYSNNGYDFTVAASTGAVESCSGSVSNLVITGPGSGVDQVITPVTGTVNCSSSGSGGGGGGAPAPTPTPTPTPTSTPTPTPTPVTPATPAVPGVSPATPASPSGVTLYRAEGDNRVYVVKDGKKTWVKTAEEFNSKGYKWTDIVVTNSAVLAAYPESLAGLFRAVNDTKVYFIENSSKHWIKTAAEFKAGGYKWSDVTEVAASALASYSDDAAVPASSSGVTLYRAEGDNRVYVVKDGKKNWVKSAEEFNSKGYKWTDIVLTTAANIASYPDGIIVSVTVKVVNTSSLRVRKSNTTSSDILGSVKKDDIFDVLEENTGWYKVKTSNGVIGWISGTYAEKQ